MQRINELTGHRKTTMQPEQTGNRLPYVRPENFFSGCDQVALKKFFVEMANVVIKANDPRAKFIVDQANTRLIADLFNYFTGQEGNLDLTKGIWLQGDVGTGKTMLLKIFATFLGRFRKGFKLYSANDVCQLFEKSGDLDLFMNNERGYLERPVNLAIDEIGHEPIQSNHYGTKRNVIQYILHARYSLWQDTGLKTYVTTNLSMQDVYDRYGEAIEDRIAEMFNVIPVTGESRR